MPNSIVAELQAEHWAMEPSRLEAFIEQAAALPEMSSMPDVAVSQEAKTYKVADGMAVIAISGVLLKTVPAWVRFWGIEATGYDEIRSQIAAAVSDKSIARIHLQVDSPGGMVAGAVEAADAIYNARAEKPVTATIEDLGASGAYWLTSQAQSIETGRNTMVGSIGVFSIYVDWSKQLEEAGIKVIVIRSGAHKGMGIDKITDEQVAAVQEIIDGMAENFIEAVARGRGSSAEKIRELATGQLWIAGAARELGLIDAVTDDGTNQTNIKSQVKGANVMDAKEQLEKEKAASEQAKIASEAISTATVEKERQRMTALQAEFKDDPDFAIAQFGAGASLEEAKAAYCDVLREKLAKQKSEHEASSIENPEGEGDAIAPGGTDGTSESDFLTEAKELAKEEGITVTAAMQKINRRNPGAHAQFLQRCETEGKAMYAVA